MQAANLAQDEISHTALENPPVASFRNERSLAPFRIGEGWGGSKFSFSGVVPFINVHFPHASTGTNHLLLKAHPYLQRDLF